MTAAKITRTPDGGINLKFPYIAELVEDLKSAIPGWGRQYDPYTKQWYVLPSFVDVAEEIFYFYFPRKHNFSHSPPDLFATLPDWCKTLYILPNAPGVVIDAVYRALSKIYHPDVGGSHSAMLKLNAAIEEARNYAKNEN